jgi:transcriptional regulator with XRE-family HTH domain
VNLFGVTPARERLARELARLRVTAHLTQPQLAQRLDWSQAKVSRIETAKQAVEPADVDAWAHATSAPDQLREALTALAIDAKVGGVSIERALASGLPAAQVETGKLEASARMLCVYQPVIIPGLLQTPGYVRQIFAAGYPEGRPDIDQAIAARLARQEILYDEGRRFEFVLPEAALRWRFGSTDMLLRQLTGIRQQLSLPNVSIGLIPQHTDAPIWHTHGFVIFDDRDDEDPIVTVETLTAVLPFDSPTAVEEYRQTFARLKSVAVHGEQAHSLLDQIAEDFRRS